MSRGGAILAMLLAGAPIAARAGGIYRYVDPDGTIVYTNVPPASSKGAKKLAGDFHAPPKKTDPPPPLPRAPFAQAMAAAASGSLGQTAPMTTSVISLTQYDELITEAALKYKIPPNLVRAVMHAESYFDPQALSPVGASGLMQLMPETARDMYVKDIFDARENIEGGTRYLRVLANEFDGDMVKMVAAYNAGPDAVKKYGGNVPPYPETQAYVRKVLTLYFQYKAQTQAANEKAGKDK
jgi:soluble lytic murein transglycosylase-like protein